MSATPYIEQAGSLIASPVLDKGSGNLFYVGMGSGEVCVVGPEEGGAPDATVWANSGGQPSGVAFDTEGNAFVADLAQGAIVSVAEDGSQQTVVKVYEERPLKGPNSLTFDSSGTMFFTDSGPLGETTLASPTGSCFCITLGREGHILKPLALNCLAHPSGLALSADERSLFVCEMLTNRLLRFFQQPTGVYHASVFKQFAGGVGPSAVAVDRRGYMYVAHYDVAPAAEGRVTVLSPEGATENELSVPGPQLTGLCLSADERELFVTEASSDTIFRLAVP